MIMLEMSRSPIDLGLHPSWLQYERGVFNDMAGQQRWVYAIDTEVRTSRTKSMIEKNGGTKTKEQGVGLPIFLRNFF